MDARARYAAEMRKTVERLLAGRFERHGRFAEKPLFERTVKETRAELTDELLLAEIDTQRELVADGHSTAHPYMLAAYLVVAGERGLPVDD